jgi:hypothetical protein
MRGWHIALVAAALIAALSTCGGEEPGCRVPGGNHAVGDTWQETVFDVTCTCDSERRIACRYIGCDPATAPQRTCTNRGRSYGPCEAFFAEDGCNLCDCAEGCTLKDCGR